jgi:hypothetical protein
MIERRIGMTIKQLSLFVENRVGSLLDVTSVLKENGVDMHAFSVAETTDFGIVRLLVDKPKQACEKLRAAGLTVVETPVIGVLLEDAPGTFHNVLQALYEAKISIEYTYAFAKNGGSHKAYMVLRVEDPEYAAEALQKAGFTLLAPGDVYAVE